MKPRIHLAIVMACALIGAVASAQKPIGVWKGKAEMTTPVPKTEAERKQMEKVQEQTRKMVFHLTFKTDNKFSLAVDNGITRDAGPKAAKDEGTWTQTGRFITLHSSHSMTPPITGNISPDGKSLKLLLVGKGGASGRLTFVRS